LSIDCCMLNNEWRTTHQSTTTNTNQ
jgi:hypothetical protein